MFIYFQVVNTMAPINSTTFVPNTMTLRMHAGKWQRAIYPILDICIKIKISSIKRICSSVTISAVTRIKVMNSLVTLHRQEILLFIFMLVLPILV